MKDKTIDNTTDCLKCYVFTNDDVPSYFFPYMQVKPTNTALKTKDIGTSEEV